MRALILNFLQGRSSQCESKKQHGAFIGLNLPLDIRGTAFQQRVWQALRQISAGSTLSYAEIAKRIGPPKATRAIAQTCDANRFAVAIFCHRVVKNDGSLSGYRWGVECKRALLQKEERYL
ncbi:MAG: hypothetical protein AUH05_09790 [Ktedonobacter sp. 13_2_20CM_53_11]|nr:MAG: hypothetical protein AUH05_09790 [Ktedonobacter sp. 13_2_20CM_53_11]